MRGATLRAAHSWTQKAPDFNPRAPCGARLAQKGKTTGKHGISIHAPHAGRDGSSPLTPAIYIFISIHAPHAGRDSIGKNIAAARKAFQSTRPMRGATAKSTTYPGYTGFQSTRPMRGATAWRSTEEAAKIFQSTRPMRGATEIVLVEDTIGQISIHAPHAGRDLFTPLYTSCCFSFQSTRPMRGAT